MKRPALYFLLILSCCIYSRSRAAVSDADSLTVPKMPLLAWFSIPEAYTDSNRFGELAETGINQSLTFYSSADAAMKALDMAEKANVKVIVACPELETETEKTVRRFMNHPALAGYYLRDEPDVSLFQKLSAWVRKIEAVDSTHYCYINLFPNFVSPNSLGTPEYSDYVTRFLEEVPVRYLSFDNYPIVGKKLRPLWYQNLEIIANSSRQFNLPFRAFALTTAHSKYPIPGLAELRLQVFSNLAYGAQGIQYFTYWTPPPVEWDFHHGPINAEGQRTSTYELIRTMNAEINALSGVFLGAKLISVHHTGTFIPKGTNRLKKLPLPFLRLKTGNPGAVVSFLQNENKKYLVIVNRSMMESTAVRIEFNSDSVKQVMKDGKTRSLPGRFSRFDVEPGDVLILNYP